MNNLNKNQFNQIIELLTNLDKDIRQTNNQLKETNKRLEERIEETDKKFKTWDDRYFSFVQQQSNLTTNVILGASAIAIFAPTLKIVVEFFLNK